MFQAFPGSDRKRVICFALISAIWLLPTLDAFAFTPEWRIKYLPRNPFPAFPGELGGRMLAQARALGQNSSEKIQIIAVLRRAPVTPNGWLLETAERERYLILNPDGFLKNRLFQPGTMLSVTGRLRPDVSLPDSEGKALTVSKMTSAPLSEPSSITGILNPTVEPGGWTATDLETGQKYVLLGTQAVEEEPWFKKGQRVKVKGTVRKDIPTIFQEGPVLVIHRIKDAQTHAHKGGTIFLFYPNRSNTTGSLLGNSVSRRFHGDVTPELVMKALLKGPSPAEQKHGYFLETELQSVRPVSISVSPAGDAEVVLEAPASLDFKDPEVLPRFYEQVRLTLKSFEAIQQVKLVIQDEQGREKWRFP